jgi:hypothetical protein
MKRFLTIIYAFFSLITFAQSDSIAYSRDYEFTEGFFLAADQFKNNDPVLKSSIISGIPKNQLDFMKQVLENKSILYKDSLSQEKNIETYSIWGYCQNRSVYINIIKAFNKTDLLYIKSINVDHEFRKLNVIGTLCHFTANVITPFGINGDPMNSFNNNLSSLYNTNEELKQYVFDTQTNKVFDFNVKNMEILLKNDTSLYDQFMALKKREKPDVIFVYLRKFNEKHPLYLLQK